MTESDWASSRQDSEASPPGLHHPPSLPGHNNRLPKLGHHEFRSRHTMLIECLAQVTRGIVDRLVGELKRAEVHSHADAGTHIQVNLHGLLRIHMRPF